MSDQPASAATSTATPSRVPATLDLAVVIVAVEAAVQVAVLWSGASEGFGNADAGDVGAGAWRSTPAALSVLTAAIVGKVVLALRARRFKAGSALLLMAMEAVGLLAALAADWAVPVRLLVVATVVTVIGLIGKSLSAFPEPDLPTTVHPAPLDRDQP